MNLIEENPTAAAFHDLPGLPPAATPPPPSNVGARLWHQWLVGLLFAGLSVGLSGLFYFKNQMDRAAEQALSQFHWLVLVQGDSLQSDEVGRFLRQIDGVSDVSFVSAQQSLERYQKDANLAAELDSLDVNPFPPSWKVVWKDTMLDPVKMQETLQDLRTLPGVVDIAFDEKILKEAHLFRLHGYQVKTLLSGLIVLFAIFASALFGRFFFFPRARPLDPRKSVAALLVDSVFWAGGWLAVCQLLGDVPLQLLIIGPVLGCCRLAWSSCRNP